MWLPGIFYRAREGFYATRRVHKNRQGPYKNLKANEIESGRLCMF